VSSVIIDGSLATAQGGARGDSGALIHLEGNGTVQYDHQHLGQNALGRHQIELFDPLQPTD
jgi:hypothetical protein